MNIQFINPDRKLTEAMIAECEIALGLELPRPLRECYLRANGGEPHPYVFETDAIDTVVSEFLPLDSERQSTAVQSYRRLVLDRKLVPRQFFPFAVDGGGDYFFCDTRQPLGAVYFYNSDSAESGPLVDLNLNVDEFWEALKPE